MKYLYFLPVIILILGALVFAIKDDPKVTFIALGITAVVGAAAGLFAYGVTQL